MLSTPTEAIRGSRHRTHRNTPFMNDATTTTNVPLDPTWPPPPPSSKKGWTTRTKLLVLGAATIAALTGVGLLVDNGSDAADNDSSETAVDAASGAVEGGARETTKPTTEASEKLTLDDVAINLIVLENQCYDSAGALITFEPELGVGEDGDAGGRYTLTYDVTGGGAHQTYSIEIDGTRYSNDQHMVSTDTCVSFLTATPTRLIER